MVGVRRVGFAAGVLCAVCAQAVTAQPVTGQDYWSYSYKGIDVVTASGSASTATLAHDLVRFDVALTRILQLPGRRVPTRVYKLAGADAHDILGVDRASTYRYSDYDVSVITSTGADTGSRYWGELIGYTGAILRTGRAARMPVWYRFGVPQLFAQTEFTQTRVATGGISAGLMQIVWHSRLIPMRVFLSIHGDDPQLRNADFKTLFEAESWYLAREIFVQGKLRPEFGHYLALIHDGKTEAEAFAASFKISYEDLDKLLVEAMQEPARQFVVEVPPEPVDPGQAHKLSVADVKAMNASLALAENHANSRTDALRWIGEALAADPNNELALRTLARASCQQRDFAACLGAVDRISALTTPSAAALADGGDALSRLMRVVSEKQAAVGFSAEALSGRAKAAYESAVQSDPEQLQAWVGLANLYAFARDTDAARALLPRAQPVMERHLDSAPLARALANMCSRTGQTDAAFLFGEYWRTNAWSQADLEQAQAFMAGLGRR